MYKLSQFTSFYEFKGKRVVYNSLTGYLGLLDETTYQYLNNIANDQNPQNNKNFLLAKEKGIIVKSDINEYNQYMLNSKAEQFSVHPEELDFVIATTRECNYRCTYCFEKKNTASLSMDRQTQDATIRFIRKSIEESGCCKRLHITWFGGEPLLNPYCISHISENLILYCDSLNIQYSADIITNGSLVDYKAFNLFKDYKIRNVQITMDGDMDKYCEYKGTNRESFERVMRGIERMPHDVRLLLRFNVDNGNYDSVKSIAKKIISKMDEYRRKNVVFYLAPIEGKECLLIKDDSFNVMNDDFIEFLKSNDMKASVLGNLPQSRFVSCGALKRGNFCIDANGNLVKCEHAIGDDNKACGDVFTGPDYSDNECVFYSDNTSEECKICAYLPVCRGGCVYQGKEKGIKVDCDGLKKRIEHVLMNVTEM